MASAGTVAVLLPGAYYALEEKKKPPVALLRKHKVPIAVATDCNPGTSPLLSPTLAMNMACTLFGLTPDEALQGMTTHAQYGSCFGSGMCGNRRRLGPDEGFPCRPLGLAGEWVNGGPVLFCAGTVTK